MAGKDNPTSGFAPGRLDALHIRRLQRSGLIYMVAPCTPQQQKIPALRFRKSKKGKLSYHKQNVWQILPVSEQDGF